MKVITVQDCLNLRKKFKKYCETAEHFEFARLFMLERMMDHTIENIISKGVVEDQKEAGAMIRVISKYIGEDASDYLED